MDNKLVRINFGCGGSPTDGYINIDNSPSIVISKAPNFLIHFLYKVGIIGEKNYNYIRFCKLNSIVYGSAVSRLLFQDCSVDLIYSSHMLEHLEKNNAKKFLAETLRVLKPGGFLRIAVPDLNLIVKNYLETQDGDAFIEQLGICRDLPDNFFIRIYLFFLGSRHHKWAYDENSLTALLKKTGFTHVYILSSGETKMTFHGNINLSERKSESLYVEAVK